MKSKIYDLSVKSLKGTVTLTVRELKALLNAAYKEGYYDGKKDSGYKDHDVWESKWNTTPVDTKLYTHYTYDDASKKLYDYSTCDAYDSSSVEWLLDDDNELKKYKKVNDDED